MTNKIKNFLIGSDFEIFLMHKQSKEIVSAEGIIKGTKHKPFVFDSENKFFATCLDNILAEAGIPPTNNKEEWIKAIEKSKDYIQSILPGELCTASVASARVNEKYLQTDNARLLGCESDYCVWTRRTNEKPNALGNLRSTGAHQHISFDNPTTSTAEELIKAMDLHLSVPGVLMEPESERKKLYGKAGCFRMPHYGVEYRSLSGWYASTPELSGWVFDNTLKAIQFINDNRIEEIEAVKEQIIGAVNNNDKVIAGNLIRQFDLELI